MTTLTLMKRLRKHEKEGKKVCRIAEMMKKEHLKKR